MGGWLLVAEGSDVEVYATVTKARFYQNLTAAATVMGFYDVKNARLCNIYEGTGLTHREPALDEQDFERYLKSFAPLMQSGRDVMWVLGGRTDTNRVKIKRILAKNLFHVQVFHLCRNTKQMTTHVTGASPMQNRSCKTPLTHCAHHDPQKK